MSAYGFMPHGYCFEWRPGVLWLHVVSDASIAFAYFGIGLLLYYFSRVRRDVPFRLLFWLFASFIVLCGTTHLFSIWVLWRPDYYVEGYVKAATAIVSVGTLAVLAFILPGMLKAALSLQAVVATQTGELVKVNAELRAQVTARETVESALRQAQKMEAIGQLTGGIAHDFNNLLQAIGGSLELAHMRLGKGRDRDVEHNLEVARNTVGRASALTNRLLAFARRQPLQPRPVHVDQLIVGLEQLIAGTAKLPGPAIAVELRLESEGTVMCDQNQLESAILNVVINARDAVQAGGRITILTRRTTITPEQAAGTDGASPGAHVEIAISDTGAGMDELTRLRVFEPFFTTKPLGQGTGLGLSQVYGFARQSGGYAAIESRMGEGTTVRLLLPRVDTSAAPPGVRPSSEKARGHATLLLVEDEPHVRSVTADYLRELDYLVLEAEDAAQAIKLLREHPGFDLMVTDVGLPHGMNGRQLADVAREFDPRLPVMFITGYAGDADMERLGPAMRLTRKPFTLPDLAKQIAAMLNVPEPAQPA